MYEKDDEFDLLLNDFKNYQITKKEEKEEDEWFWVLVHILFMPENSYEKPFKYFSIF